MALYFKKINKPKKIITNKTIHRTSLLSKATGLMLHKKILNEAHIFYFKKPIKIEITMLFVFFPIDIIFLNKNKIIEIKENLKPFRHYKAKNQANTFIELPRGHIKKHNLEINDEIIIN
ncbi:MAG: DUF192 domain-containing protein [Candidatus Woesearchaeota archaeon]